jgi:SAM-dependent methyltransferase
MNIHRIDPSQPPQIPDRRSSLLRQSAIDLQTWVSDYREPGTDHIATNTFQVVEIIELLEGSGLIKPGQSVIDLGSGFGTTCLLFAMAGYNATGYEIATKPCEIGRVKMNDLAAQGAFAGSCDLIKGSYFPAQFLRGVPLLDRLDGKSHYIDGSSDNTTPLFVPGQITKEQLQKFDCFYAYPWPDQFLSVLKLFTEFSKPEAVFVTPWKRTKYMEQYFRYAEKNCDLQWIEDNIAIHKPAKQSFDAIRSLLAHFDFGRARRDSSG